MKCDKFKTDIDVVDINILNAKVLNVFTMEFIDEDVMIKDNMIVGFGRLDATQTIDAAGKYLVPGLIDGHMHIESTMLTPVDFSKVALSNGVTTAFADCHEIANVLGTKGIDFMLGEIEKSLMDIRLMLPSSVPCSRINKGSNQICASDLQEYYSNPLVNGLAEVMDYNRLANNDKDYVKKLQDCVEANMPIDGHMAGLDISQVDKSRVHGISTDHECETTTDLIERISRGVHIHIREGSAAKNFTELMSAVNLKNHNQISFCTDDISIVDLIEKGSINNIIKKGIKQGYEPELLLKMATLNAARAYNINNIGAIAPGYVADIVILDNLEEFKINSVIKSGKIMDDYIGFENEVKLQNEMVANTINIVLDENQIDLQPKQSIAIGINNGTLITEKHEVEEHEKHDLCKVVVINRYGEEKYCVSYLKGIELSNETIGSTISHDHHNVVIIGKSDEEIRKLIKCIKNSNGGIFSLVGNKLNNCPLDVAGLMSTESIANTYVEYKKLLESVSHINFDEIFLAMSFLTLDVIPYIKITDIGLYDFTENKII
ncbi:adenine deaminase C-terminal domain-containing protein [Mollicutes bacterium LVI A0039]|nr:adenine deaminase C-terminal domain-containing protein [Mollicutes bacterium LVI A0039]